MLRKLKQEESAKAAEDIRENEGEEEDEEEEEKEEEDTVKVNTAKRMDVGGEKLILEALKVGKGCKIRIYIISFIGFKLAIS